MKGKKFDPRKASSFKRTLKELEEKPRTKEPYVVLSLKDFDRTQGQSFGEWQEDKLLSLALDRLSQVCSLTMREATTQQIIKRYDKVDFPPETAFTHPKHVPVGVTWASMHVQGKECVIGYVEENIFHIVFLDKDHQFWISKKK